MLQRPAKHKALRETLRAALARGDYGVGAKLPSENELAAMHGVSRTTVREAIAGLVHEGLVTRSQGMRISVARLPDDPPDIAFVLCGRDYTDPHYSRILKGAEQRCTELGYRLLYSHWSEPNDLRSLENTLMNHRPVKGIVVTGILELRSLLGLMDMNPNVVLVGETTGPERTPSVVVRVVSNDYEASRMAVNHLLELGHRRIALITGDLNRCWFREPYDAYRKCLADQGLPVDPQWVVVCPDQSPDHGYRAAEQLLQAPTRPTALFAANDRLAWGAIRALRQARLEVPGDVSVVGTGDLSIGDERNFLTTMAVSQVTMGALAVERIAAGASGKTEQVVVPMELLSRRSCAPLNTRRSASLLEASECSVAG